MVVTETVRLPLNPRKFGRVNYRPNFLGFNGNLSVAVTPTNIPRAISALLPRADNAQGSALRAVSDLSTLFVTGLDSTARL